MWERELKPPENTKKSLSNSIAPYVGAWVETCYIQSRLPKIGDCSLRGSVNWNYNWKGITSCAANRSLRGSVSWNSKSALALALSCWSLPTWERELKLEVRIFRMFCEKSLPPWERELKHRDVSSYYDSKLNCFLRGSVSWNFNDQKSTSVRWIAPYVGAWVETDKTNLTNQRRLIAPCMGAWIETQFAQMRYCSNILSLPAWERELKEV